MELTLIFSISILGLLFAVYLIRNVMNRDTGTPRMREISDAIKSGAEAFLSRQYRTIIYLAVALTAIIYILYAVAKSQEKALSRAVRAEDDGARAGRDLESDAIDEHGAARLEA